MCGVIILLFPVLLDQRRVCGFSFGGPLDRSSDWWQAFTWLNKNRGKAAASNPISCRKRKGRVSSTIWSGRSYLQLCISYSSQR